MITHDEFIQDPAVMMERRRQGLTVPRHVHICPFCGQNYTALPGDPCGDCRDQFELEIDAYDREQCEQRIERGWKRRVQHLWNDVTGQVRPE